MKASAIHASLVAVNRRKKEKRKKKGVDQRLRGPKRGVPGCLRAPLRYTMLVMSLRGEPALLHHRRGKIPPCYSPGRVWLWPRCAPCDARVVSGGYLDKHSGSRAVTIFIYIAHVVRTQMFCCVKTRIWNIDIREGKTPVADLVCWGIQRLKHFQAVNENRMFRVEKSDAWLAFRLLGS